jgi:hypothetical protein
MDDGASRRARLSLHRKAASNARKHGVTFEEAASVFADPLALAIGGAFKGEADAHPHGVKPQAPLPSR